MQRKPEDAGLSLIDLFKKYHKPEAITSGDMVYEVWEDGEITLTKGGPLFRQRSLHCIQMAGLNQLCTEDMPIQAWGHGSVAVADNDTARYLADQLAQFKAS